MRFRATGLSLLLFFLGVSTWISASTLEVIKALGGADTGQNPQGSLLKSDDGLFYGTTRNGGRYGYGTIYRISADGTLTTLVNFNDMNGRYPESGLVMRADGNFFGTTTYGGSGGNGTIFKLTPSGIFSTIVSFNGPNGNQPSGKLTAGSDGNIYGTTSGGGSHNYGTVFRIAPNDSFSSIGVFNYTNGAVPLGPLVEMAPGQFLGIFRTGAPSPDSGGVFKVDSNGAITTFSAFQGTTSSPQAGLIKASDGNFYGTSSQGGTNNIGSIYKLTPAGAVSVISSFTGFESASPKSELIEGPGGYLYGSSVGISASSIPGGIFRVSLGGTLSMLATFPINTSASPLCFDTNGNLIGVTGSGGQDNKGTVYRIGTAGGLTVLTSFKGDNPARPEGGLTPGLNGVLYGATPSGGTHGHGAWFSFSPEGELTILSNGDAANPNPRDAPFLSADGNLYCTISRGGIYGDGSVFQLSLTGVVTPIFSFNRFYPGSVWGNRPNGGIIEADGMLYGTTTNGDHANFGGTLFKVTKSGSISLLKSFSGPDGAVPGPGIVRMSDGTIYGTTRHGGSSGYGTVFTISPTGTHTILASFSETTGRLPNGGMVWSSTGELLGTTSNGGVHGYGTIFSVNTSGNLTILHSFQGTDGSYPYAGLLLASDGNYYGTTYSGGSGGGGTVFRLTPGGAVTVIASLAGAGGVYGGVAESSEGDLYGMTQGGGDLDAGTIFRITFRPPTIIPSDFPGGVTNGSYTIRGRHFGPTSSVTMGGVSIPFTVVSPSEIKATLPGSNFSGIIRVITPEGSADTSGLVHSVSALNADDDQDGLPNGWEIQSGINPNDDGSVHADEGAQGDGDRDGIPLLVEWSLEHMGFSPKKSDCGLLNQPSILEGYLSWAYIRDSSKSVTLMIEVSSDLQHWYKIGDHGGPPGFTDVITGQNPPYESRKASVQIPEGSNASSVFFRLKASK